MEINRYCKSAHALIVILFLVQLVSLSNASFFKEVTDDNFDKLLDPEKASIMMEFYAPWCGHVSTANFLTAILPIN